MPYTLIKIPIHILGRSSTPLYESLPAFIQNHHFFNDRFEELENFWFVRLVVNSVVTIRRYSVAMELRRIAHRPTLNESIVTINRKLS